MKPLHIVLLVGAGALGGVMLTNSLQRSPQAAPASAVALAPAPVPESVPPTVPTPLTEPAKPSPAPARPVRKDAAPRPRPVRAESPHGRPRPVEVAQLPAAAAPSFAPAPETAAAPIAIPARPAPEPVAPAAPPPPSPPNKVTLNAGATIPVRLIDGLSSGRNNPGDVFTATLDQELVVDGFVIAERGARAEGRVASADRGSKASGGAALAVELTRVHTSDGQTVEVSTESIQKQGPRTQGQTAAKVGGGAGAVALSAGQAVTLPSETRITFRIWTPVTITERKP